MNDTHIPSPCRLTNTQCNFQWVSKSRVTPDSYHSTLSLRDNHDRVFSFRVTSDSYHSTLSLRDHHDRVFSLLGNRTFRPTLRASYIHTEISDISTGLLHPHRNFKQLHGSLTPTQKFRIAPRVSYTHTEIWDSPLPPPPPRVSYTHTEIRESSPVLLHPHRNSGYLPGSLTPTQKFGISSRKNLGYLPGSLTPTQDLSDTIAGLLHPNSRLFHQRGLTPPPPPPPPPPLLSLPNTH